MQAGNSTDLAPSSGTSPEEAEKEEKKSASAEAPALDLYFNPQFEEFATRTTWSLSNAFTSAFKELEAIAQFRATAKLGAFLEGVRAA